MAKRTKGKGDERGIIINTGRWASDEIKLLKKLFRNTTTPKVAQQLRRSVPSVQAKASTLGLKKTKKHLKLVRGGK